MFRPVSLLLPLLVLVSMKQSIGRPKPPEPPPPITPKEPIALFNGKDLSEFYTWLVDTKREDPRRVFTVQDKMIRISGDGFGYLATEKRYANYELVAEFKWGEKNFRGRENKARDSGIFFHADGADGNSTDGNGAYKAAIECQIMEGAVGDFLKIRGNYIWEFNGVRALVPISPNWTANISDIRDPDGYPWWKKGGEVLSYREVVGRLNWKLKDPQWKDVLGFRGNQDVESPAGQWTRIHCICWDRTITIAVNDQVVNQIKDVSFNAGQILLQCEGSEIYFRRLELHPLPKIEEVK
jgi:hypothetical protein